VVLQPVPDRQRLAHRDPERRQLILRADPRQHQQDRGLVAAGGQDHLAIGADLLDLAVAGDLHPDRSVTGEEDPQRERAGDHVQVLPSGRRMQVRVRRAAAQAVALGELKAADALLASAVEVGIAFVPGLLGGLEHRVDERVQGPAVGHSQRSADPMVRVLATLVVLGTLEVGQDVGV
jgi:hypothetical protein